jgi:antimicrobial peptide system SdpA family protein
MKKYFLLSVIFLTFVVFVFFIFKNSLGYNIQSSSYQKIIFLSKISPQGWGFFTKTPRDPNVHIFVVRDGKISKRILYQNFTSNNLLGFTRKNRMIAFEISQILMRSKNIQWQNYTKNISDLPIVKVFDNDLYYLRDNDFLLVKEEIPPYLWRNKIQNPDKLKKMLYVKCYTK